MKRECPDPQPWCRYAELGGCFSDTDHIVPRRLGTTALAKAYIDLPENKQQLCRRLHDEKTAGGDEPLPDDETMREAIARAQAAGEATLSRTRLKRALGAGWMEYVRLAAFPAETGDPA